MTINNKIIIYQLLPRLFGNRKTVNKFNGSLADNGSGTFNDITDTALNGIRKLGCSHIWYTGVLEHACTEGYPEYGLPPDPTEIVKGRAGSPYAIKDYYDVCPYLATDPIHRMDEFRELIRRTHQAGLGVIIDHVPNHVSRAYKSDAKPAGIKELGADDRKDTAFSASNDFYYIPGKELLLPSSAFKQITGESERTYKEYPARATGNDVFTENPSSDDWYETIKLNYGVDYQNNKTQHFSPIPPLWHKMRHIMEYWLNLGVDGFRCDMAEMVPVDYWSWVISEVKLQYPETLFIAEIYQPEIYVSYLQAGFDFLYDKVGFYDRVREIYSGEHGVHNMTRAWQDLQGLDRFMLRFLENHDEQRLASKSFLENPHLAIPGMVAAATMNKGPVLIYSGQESGETGDEASGYSGPDGRTTIYDFWGLSQHQKWMNGGKFDGGMLDKEEQKLRNFYSKILKLSNDKSVFNKGHFYDLLWANDHLNFETDAKVYPYLRYLDEEIILIVLNFDLSERNDVRVYIPGDAAAAIQLDGNTEYEGFELLSGKLLFSFRGNEIIKGGIEIRISAAGAVIIELRPVLI